MSSGAMRKKFVVQQPPFVANSSGNGGVRPKRREDHNNNDLDHFPGRQGLPKILEIALFVEDNMTEQIIVF